MIASHSQQHRFEPSLTSSCSHALPSEERATLPDTTDNTSAFTGNGLLPGAVDAATVSDKIPSAIQEPPLIAPATKDHNPAGIQPVADFVPTEPAHSHPTPPPDPPVTSISAIVEPTHADTPPAEPASIADVVAPQPVDPEPAPVPVLPQTGTSAVTESVVAPVAEVSEPEEPSTTAASDLPSSVQEGGEALLNGMTTPSVPEPSAAMSTEPALPTVSTAEPSAPTLVRQRDEEGDDEPAAKRSKIEEPEVDTTMPDVPAAESTAPAPADVPGDISMTDLSTTEIATPAVAEPSTPVGVQSYHTTPMTSLQKSYLLEKTKNLKKTKHASAFLFPVDPVKLNIPNYPTIVKNPMDLGTLENKLKGDQYASPQAYADDFNQIVTNTKLFNGEAHVVTIAANNMEAYFKKYMSSVPGPDQTVATKAKKQQEPAISRPQPRREARVPPPQPIKNEHVAASPATAAGQTFALQADGTPQIRRDSTTKRPHRTIKPPQNRELSYAKPKRKEHQLELRFCEHILDEMRSASYGEINYVFLLPVDPVALNIPHYHQIVKKPMDMSTMGQKLKAGQYGTAKEFKADFDLMIDNCLKFNPEGNPVHNIGLRMRQAFEGLWKEKDKWERANKKSSERASSASDDESEEESEDEADDEDPVPASTRETIAALTKQLAELQKTVETAQWSKDSKKKSKDGKKSKKNSLSAAKPKAAASKSKAPKKIKPLSYDEKQEISNAVGQMNEQQVGRLTQIITDNCEKYRNMGDDMELEIDDLPNDVQALLLKHVRSIFGNPNRGARVASPDDLAAEDDDDFAPPARDRASAGGKRKKHKPMGKKEQQESINELRNRLAAFKNPAESESPRSGQAYGHPADDTSGDEESEESEEE